jgi:hypothetical protein
MKIIDTTPFLDERGQLSLQNRVQAMLKYGLSWPSELKAQDAVIAQLNKVLEKGFTLFRNKTLGASDIVIPLILLGPPGIYVIYVTSLRGTYRAKGTDWGTVSGNKFQPAPINLLTRVTRLAKVLEVFFQRQGLTLPTPIEPVLMAADPGLYVESNRSAVRVVMSDAIDRFATSLLQARPIINSQLLPSLVDHIESPRASTRQEKPTLPPEAESPATDAGARMQSILNSPKSDTLIESGQTDLGFAFDESQAARPSTLETSPSRPGGRGVPRPKSRRVAGMTLPQLLILIGIFACWLCLLGASIGYLFFFQPLP